METVAKDDVHYVAFISYRHRPLDREAAVKVQRRIESYTVPKALRKDGKKKLGKVFRDEDELPVSSSLSDSITYALDHTEYLIVICTPDLPLSKWCEEEIRYFTKTHDRDHVIGVLADGTPDVSFSPYMLHTFDEEGNFLADVEPLAANIAGKDHTIDKKAFNKEIYRIYAALIGCRFDELWQRERRAKTRRAAIMLGGAAAALAVFSGFMLMQNAKIKKQNEQITSQNEQITKQNTEITEKSERISEQNELISKQNDELKQKLSRIEAESGRARLEGCWIDDALTSGIKAMESAGEAYDRSAVKLLSDALGSYSTGRYRSAVAHEFFAHITDLETTDDCKYTVLLDSIGRMICIETDTGSVKWSYTTPSLDNYYIFTVGTIGELDHYAELLPIRNNDIVIYKDYVQVIALSVADGSVLWQYEYACSYLNYRTMAPNLDCNAFRVLSEDGSRLALIDKEDKESEGIDLFVLDTKTGSSVSRVHLDTEASDETEFWYLTGGSFTEDLSCLTAVIFDGEDYRFYVVDTNTSTLLHDYRCDKEELNLRRSIVYGASYDKATGELFSAIYQSRKGGIVTIVFRPDGTMVHEQNYASISSVRGKFYEWDEYDDSLNTMLTADGSALVFCDETVYLFDAHTGELKNSFDLSGKVIDRFWYDREAPTVAILSDSGVAVIYTFGDHFNVLSFGSITYDRTGLQFGRLTRKGLIGEKRNIRLVSVRSEKDNCLLATEYYKDPGVTVQDASFIGGGSAIITDDSAFSPSGNRLFVFYKISGDSGTELTAAVYDASGSELIAAVSFPYDSASVPLVIDDGHFAYGPKICSIDGSFEYLEGITDTSVSRLDPDSRRSFLLTGGDLLSIEKFPSDSSYRYWINGKAMGTLPDMPHNLMPLDSDSCSSSGLVMYYGDFNDDWTWEFSFFDVRTKKQYTFDQPDDVHINNCAMGRSTSTLALLYDGCKVMLFDIEAGTSRPLMEFQDDELVISWGFSEDDKYFFMMTDAKRLEGFSCATGELVFSVYAESAPKQDGEVGLWLKCIASEDGKTFDITIRTKDSWESVFRGLWVRIDAESNQILQEANDVIDYSESADSLLFYMDDETGVSPVHSADELLALAKARLEGADQ